MDAPHPEFVFSNKLMAGVNISVRSDSHVLAARAAAPQPLNNAGPLGQVHVEVEEVNVLPIHQGPGQLLILLLHPAQVLFLDSEGIVGGTAAGLYRDMAEAKIRRR